jgi:transposase
MIRPLRLLKRLNLSRQKTRPSHPKGHPAAQAAFKKGAAVTAANHRRRAS